MDWTGLSECDQSELGLIVNGDTTDPEASPKGQLNYASSATVQL